MAVGIFLDSSCGVIRCSPNWSQHLEGGGSLQSIRSLMAKRFAAALLMGAAVLTMLAFAPISTAYAAATMVTPRYAGGISGTYGGYTLTAPTSVVRQGTALYVLDASADSGRGRVFQFTLTIGSGNGPVTAQFVRSWGARGTSNSNIGTQQNFSNPQGIAISHNDNVTVADTGNNRVLQYSLTGTYNRTIGSAGSGNRQFLQPVAVAQSPISNALYVLDRQVGGTTAPRVQYFNPGGQYQGQFNGGTFGAITNTASGLSVSPDGRVIVTDTGKNRILAFTAAGNPVRQTGSGPGSGLAELDAPRAAEVATDSFAVTLDTGPNNRIVVYNMAAGVPTPFDSFTGPAVAVPGATLPPNPSFASANDAEYAGDHLLIVADTGRSRVQFIWLEYGYDPVDPEFPIVPIGYDDLACTDCHLSDVRAEHELKTKKGCQACHRTENRAGVPNYSLLGKDLAAEKLLMGYEDMGTCGSESNYCHSVGSKQGYHAQDGGRMQSAHWTYSAPGVKATTSYCSGSAGACHSYGSTASDLWFGSMDLASAHADYYQYQVNHYDQLTFANPADPTTPGTVDITGYTYGCTLCHDPNFYQSHGKGTKEAALNSGGRFGCPSCHVIPNQNNPGYGSYSAANPTCYRTEHWNDLSTINPPPMGPFAQAQGSALLASGLEELPLNEQVSTYIQRLIDSALGNGGDDEHASQLPGLTFGEELSSSDAVPQQSVPATRPTPLRDLLR